jgi:hypothetical protein
MTSGPPEAGGLATLFLMRHFSPRLCTNLKTAKALGLGFRSYWRWKSKADRGERIELVPPGRGAQRPSRLPLHRALLRLANKGRNGRLKLSRSSIKTEWQRGCHSVGSNQSPAE